jgi:hypothetical protein
MKYHKHEIVKVQTDLGEDDPRKNFTYEIYKDGEYIQTALTLSTAKTYIDTDYNESYL